MDTDVHSGWVHLRQGSSLNEMKESAFLCARRHLRLSFWLLSLGQAWNEKWKTVSSQAEGCEEFTRERMELVLTLFLSMAGFPLHLEILAHQNIS